DQLVVGKVEANLGGDVYEPLVRLLLVKLLRVESADVPPLLTVDEQIQKTAIVEIDPCCLPARAATLLDADLGRHVAITASRLTDEQFILDGALHARGYDSEGAANGTSRNDNGHADVSV